MLKIVKKPISKLLLYCLIVSLMILFVSSSNNILIAQDWEDENDAKIEKEAQEQLAAMLQWSAKYRFGKNLKVGDRVEYRLVGDDNNTEVELEVTKEERGGVWIVEKFDGIEFNMLVDLKTITLIDLFAYDKKGERHEPQLLDDNKVFEKIEEMKNMATAMGEMGMPIQWQEVNNTEEIPIPKGHLTCTIIEPKFSETIIKNLESSDIIEMNNAMKLYFSNDIPKLLPFEIALPAFVSSETFEIIQGGFVKNDDWELKYYNNVGE